MEQTKPKRTLSPEALEKLKLAREKALEAKRKDKEISKYEKEQKRQEKNKKRDETYQAVVKLTKAKEEPEAKAKEEPKEKPKPKPKAKPEPEPEPEPESESEEEEEEEEERPPPRKVIHKKPIPPPKTFRRRIKVEPTNELTDEDLYSNANIEMLRQRLYEQTRRRLTHELFNY